MRLSKIATCAVLLTSLALASCVSYETEIAPLGFHEGQAKVHEEILLSNIIRASYGKEPIFVRVLELDSESSITGGIAANFNVGVDASNAHVLSPGVEGGRKQKVKTVDYGASEAAEIIYQQLDRGQFRVLANRGWPSALATTVLVSNIQIDSDLFASMRQIAEQTCVASANRFCKQNKRIIAEGCVAADTHRASFFNNPNDPRNRCRFLKFKYVLNILRLAGTIIDTQYKIETENLDDDEKRTIIDFDFREESIQDQFDNLNNSEEYMNSSPISLAVRSPAEILKFVGAVAAVQIHRDHPYVPKVNIPYGSDDYVDVPILEVCDESSALRACINANLARGLAASAHVEGKRYFVPMPDPVADDRARSVEVMAYLSELLNRAQAKTRIVSGFSLIDPD